MGADCFFLVIEGIDGAGKSSIARQLHQSLAQTHPGRVTLTYEPHDPSAAGKYIRRVLAQETRASARALALAFALNRVDHLDTVVEPALAAHDKSLVISDRYLLSSLVYQTTGGLSMQDILQLNRWARPPDLTLYLSVSPNVGYARMRRRPKDRELFERNLSERARHYQTGMAMMRERGERIIEVDANGDFVQVFSSVLQVVKAQGPAWLRIQPPLLLDWREADGSA